MVKAPFTVGGIFPIAAAARTDVLFVGRKPIEEDPFLIHVAHLHDFALRACHRQLCTWLESGRLFAARDLELVIIKGRFRRNLSWQKNGDRQRQ